MKIHNLGWKLAVFHAREVDKQDCRYWLEVKFLGAPVKDNDWNKTFLHRKGWAGCRYREITIMSNWLLKYYRGYNQFVMKESYNKVNSIESEWNITHFLLKFHLGSFPEKCNYFYIQLCIKASNQITLHSCYGLFRQKWTDHETTNQ